LLSQENKNGTRFESVPSTCKNFENIIDFENMENINIFRSSVRQSFTKYHMGGRGEVGKKRKNAM